VGQKQQFGATTSDSKGNPTQDTVAWTASGGGNVDSTGLFTATAVGTWDVVAAVGAFSDKAVVTVEKAKTVSIAVTPKSATIGADESVTITAVLKDAGGNPTADVPTWSASGGTVDQTGKFQSTKTGTYTVTATFDVLTDSASVTVVPGAPDSAALTPADATIEEGATEAFSVVVKDAHGNVVPLGGALTVKWSVQGDIGTVDQDGRFTATRAGSGAVVVEASTAKGKATASAPVTVTSKPGGGGGGPGGSGGGGSAFDFMSGPLGILVIVAAVGAIAAVASLLMMRNRRRGRAQAQPSWNQGYAPHGGEWTGQEYQGQPPPGGPEWRP
jgi:hypothetical protein